MVPTYLGANAMTQGELAELRGEIFGCKILLFNCISFIAGCTDDPQAHLTTLKNAALEGIVKANPASVRPQNLRKFQDAAVGIVVQAIEGATTAHRLSTPQGRA
jgi:hypothetical protein